jgi:hypothetical protein
MDFSKQKCPYCGSSYVDSKGDVTLGFSDGTTQLICPRCEKGMPTKISDKPSTSESESPAVKQSKCFVATAAFGSPLAAEVVALRRFRDEFCVRHAAGRAFIRFYSRVGPPMADIISRSALLRRAARIPLYAICRALRFIERRKAQK